MALNPHELLNLVDRTGQRLGAVGISRIEGSRVFGRFVAEQGFESARPLFESLESAAGDQLFHEVDRISEEIGRLELKLVATDGGDSLRLEDVQIMNSGISFHVPHLQLTQVASSSAAVGS
jgi:hypothetical protein